MTEQKKETFGYTPAEYKKFRKYGWRMLILYSLFYCALYCTRLNLANAGPQMMAELGFRAADIGVLTATLFWAYAIGMLLGGRLSEMVGPSRFIILSTVLTILMNVLFGFTNSLPLMAVLWAINGFAQALNWPSGCEILANWWPGKTRGFAVGFASAFAGFGQALATVAVALSFLIFPAAGWRAAFWLPAVFPFAFLVLYLLFTRSSPAKIGLREYKEEDPKIAADEAAMQEIVEKNGKLFPYRFLLSNPMFVLVLIIHIFTGIARYGLLTWVPMYFIERFGVDVMEGLFASLALPVGMGIGSLILPTITDHMKNRMVLVPWIAVLSAATVVGFLFLDPRTAGGLILIEILLFLAGFFVYSIAAILNAITCDYGGRVFSGTANGLLGFTGYLGAGIQSVIYGTIVEKTGWNMVFISIAVLCLLSAGLSMIKKKD